MKTSYVKEKATGTIWVTTDGQDPNNPLHTEGLKNFVMSRGWDLEDYTLGFEDADVVAGWVKAQNELVMTYSDKRKAEYPSIEECIHAILDDGLEELQAKRQAVKQKYKKG